MALRFETTSWPPSPESTFLDANSLAELSRGYADPLMTTTAESIGMILSTHISSLLWSAHGKSLDEGLGTQYYDRLSAQAREIGGPVADTFNMYLSQHLNAGDKHE